MKLLKKYLCFVACGFISIANTFTQIDSSLIQKDSASLLVVVKEYEVMATQAFDFTAGIKTIEIPYAFVKNNGSMSNLSDALQTIGGIYLRSYGNQMNNAITLRGFGPERTSVLWYGMALNNAGLGQLDMNLMPGGLFNSIQLIVGSSSTQYGNGAQGGSLLLAYQPDFKNIFSLTLQQEFGSFFTWNTNVQLNYGNKNIQGRTAFIRSSSNNNYAYKDKSTVGFPTRETMNGEYFSYQGIQDLFFRFRKNWHLSIHGWFNYTDRKIPPSMGATSNNDQQFDKNIRLLTQLRKSLGKHDVQFQVAYINDQLVYHTNAFKDSSMIHTGQLQAQYGYRTHKGISLLTGGNFSTHYSAYQYYTNPIHEFRGNVFAMIKYESSKGRTSIHQQRSYQLFTLSAGIRQQFSTHYTAYPAAHLGVEYWLKKNYRIKIAGAINSSYRMPTLNDLYWVPGGKPSLLPEYSWNIEHSYRMEFGKEKGNWNLSIDLLGFFGRTHNWIQWIPNALLGYWEPQNIPDVQSAGFEGSFDFSFRKGKWDLNFQSIYNYTSAQNIQQDFAQLIYVPEHTVKGKVELKWNQSYLRLLPQFYSKRYTLSDNSQSIPSFFILNIQAGYTLQLKPCHIGFYARLGNVTHSDYQMVINRPMPGLHFNAGISFQLMNITNKQHKQ